MSPRGSGIGVTSFSLKPHTTGLIVIASPRDPTRSKRNDPNQDLPQVFADRARKADADSGSESEADGNQIARF